jgi:cell division protein FtsL
MKWMGMISKARKAYRVFENISGLIVVTSVGTICVASTVNFVNHKFVVIKAENNDLKESIALEKSQNDSLKNELSNLHPSIACEPIHDTVSKPDYQFAEFSTIIVGANDTTFFNYSYGTVKMRRSAIHDNIVRFGIPHLGTTHYVIPFAHTNPDITPHIDSFMLPKGHDSIHVTKPIK